ncbi:hypothetical protein HMPREF1487_09386 [Pseudomonas sp. HPB0071]|uniref:Uncharacterized protein n=1 Tax=Pseudomonas luteola TaxID=47886 RepID=A0A2X2CI91_PSELU|nr:MULTISPECIES: hypothetical protein [Pseudomonas]ENA27173.1 hypothetical protein HMPREF1487_09386 [Pseudomonas sp. HPB0071]MBA1250263.1 hypothetical protein [Pseudomonas zeshuii]MBH3441786.1 hypothetical protein [Pseudomonas luteola]SPY99875.1 Uncharacterised protein [Pseudomonas luteola]SPZ00051.1 Uncharacterised protein [Pseudomonas luteola]
MSEATIYEFRPKGLTPAALRGSAILKQIQDAQALILNHPIEVTNDGKGLAYGAYNCPIYYLSDGRAHHTAGEHIDQMRSTRANTHNAVELRCDALGLAIYVSGVIQVDQKVFGPRQQGNPVGRGFRVAVYHYGKKEATLCVAVVSAADLLKKLHQTLLTTFNNIAADYNLTGMSEECLVLRSSHNFFPDIPLGLADLEHCR